MKILMLCVQASRFVRTTADHLDAFMEYSANDIVQVDFRAFRHVDFDISVFDAIVLHHSISFGYGRNQITTEVIERIASFGGLKAMFVQDEMRWVDVTCQKMEQLGIKLVFSVSEPEILRDIYRTPWFEDVRFEHVLTGYVAEDLLDEEVPAYQDRHIDVCYRARRLPACYGDFGQEKSRIADRFKRDAERFDLKVDISCNENDRIYGAKWINFIKNSKAVLGAESGASFIDYSGLIAPAATEFERRNPGVPFEDVRDRFLEGRDGETVIRAISPRCFEAAALRTLMVMYDGDYSGVLDAGRHYVVLARDHSNMDEVVNIIQSPKKAEPIIDAAYREVACSQKWSYRAMVSQFDAAVGEEVERLGGATGRTPDASQIADFIEKCERRARLNAVKFNIAGAISRAYRGYNGLCENKLPHPFLDL